MTNETAQRLDRDEMLEKHVRARSSRWWRLWPLLFPGVDMSSCVVALRGVIYIPAGKTYEDLGVDVAVHESHHLKQQLEAGWLWWWIQYRLSRAFRMQQELEAYRMQYNFGVRIMPDFRGKTVYLFDLAAGMAGPTYGLGIDRDQAMKLIHDKH